MGGCCRRCCGIAPVILTQIKAKLMEMTAVFPGTTTFVVVVSPEGKVLAQGENVAYTGGEELNYLLQKMLVLKNTGLHLAATFNQMECSSIHIRGTNHMFSCYDIDKNLLAFYSTMPPAAIEAFNTSEVDTRLAPLMEQLKPMMVELAQT